MTRGKPKETVEKVLRRQPKGATQPAESLMTAVQTVPPHQNEPAATNIPEELSTVWDGEIAAAFQALRPQQQNLLLAYLETGNAAESYRRAYNRLAKDHLAGNAGAQALESIGISKILAKFQTQRTHDLFLVVKTWREMAEATRPEWVEDKNGQWSNVGDAPDWKARKDAAEGLAKLRNLNAPTEIKHSGSIAQIVQVELPKKA